jgi:hypothetical protein
MGFLATHWENESGKSHSRLNRNRLFFAATRNLKAKSMKPLKTLLKGFSRVTQYRFDVFQMLSKPLHWSRLSVWNAQSSQGESSGYLGIQVSELWNGQPPVEHWFESDIGFVQQQEVIQMEGLWCLGVGLNQRFGVGRLKNSQKQWTRPEQLYSIRQYDLIVLAPMCKHILTFEKQRSIIRLSVLW